MEYLGIRDGHGCWNIDPIWGPLGNKVILEARGMRCRALIVGPRNYSEESKEPLNIFDRWEEIQEVRYYEDKSSECNTEWLGRGEAEFKH